MDHSFAAASEEHLADLLSESQLTMKAISSATGDVFERVVNFIRLYGQLQTKPRGAALLYQEFEPPSARYRELDRPLIVGRWSKGERNPDGADLAVDDAQMSRRHFQISLADGFYLLRDLESRNGTYVNNDSTRIVEKVLRAGDVIQAGVSIFVFTGDPFTAAEETSRVR